MHFKGRCYGELFDGDVSKEKAGMIPCTEWRNEWSAQQIFFCKSWSERYARNQWRYVGHILKQGVNCWSKIMASHTFSTIYDSFGQYFPHRSQGRPRLRWGDHIQQFCISKWPSKVDKHWLDILMHGNVAQLENEYVAFLLD